MKKHLIYFSFFIVACNQLPVPDKVTISGSGNYIFLNTKGSINPKSNHLHYYENDEDSWLLYGSRELNELIIYRLPTGELEKRITFDRHGPDGIGGYRGVLVHNFDSIFLVSVTYYNNFFLTDTSGKVKEKYAPEPIGSNQMPPAIRPLSSHISNSGVFYNNRINLSTYLLKSVKNEELQHKIIDFEYDIEKNMITGITHYPIFSEKNKGSLASFCRTHNGEQFIYSFHKSDAIHIQNKHGDYIESFCGSRYRDKTLDWSYNRASPIVEMRRTGVENPCYISLIFDKYQKVYYRFFLPGYKIDKNEDIIKHADYPSIFTIVMLDENINLLGETLLPEKTYDPYMKFVGKDGLYLALHINHPMYDPDRLAFERMELIAK